MTEKTPQEEMAGKLSKMARKRAGRLVDPTITDMIKARKVKQEGGTSKRDRMAALRAVIGEGSGDRAPKTIKQIRRSNLAQTVADAKEVPQRHPFARRDK